MFFQLLVKASLVLADLENSRQVRVSPVLFFSISNLVFSYHEEIYSVIYMIYSDDNSYAIIVLLFSCPQYQRKTSFVSFSLVCE